MAGIPKILRCDEGRVFVEDGLASLFEPVLHASGVELHDLAHENETSAVASSAGEEEAPPPKDPIPIGAAGLTLHAAITATIADPASAASASSVAAVVKLSSLGTTELGHVKSLEVVAVALPDFWLDHRWEI